MDTGKYYDADGNSVSLGLLVREEPAWAENTIRAMRTRADRAERERDEARASSAALRDGLGKCEPFLGSFAMAASDQDDVETLLASPDPGATYREIAEAARAYVESGDFEGCKAVPAIARWPCGKCPACRLERAVKVGG